VRKHPRLVVGVVATLVIGLAAAGVVAWQRDRDLAVVREQKRRTREALDAMISKEMINRLAEQHRLTAEQRAFLQTAVIYYRELAAEAATDEEGRRLEADTNSRVAKLLSTLGAREEAETAAKSALAAYQRIAADYGRPVDRRDLAVSHNDLGWLLLNLDRTAEAEAEFRAAFAVAQQLVADSPDEPAWRHSLARIRHSLAGVFMRLHNPPQAEAELRAALDLYESIPPDLSAAPEQRRELAMTRYDLGISLGSQSRFSAADAALRAALPIQDGLVSEFPDGDRYRYERGRTQKMLAHVLENVHDRSAAEPLFRTALANSERLHAELPGMPEYAIELANCLSALGNFLRDGGNPAAAVKLHDRAVDIVSSVQAGEPGWLGARHEVRFARGNRALDLMALRQYAGAMPDWDRAAAADDGEYTELISMNRAECLARIGHGGEAVAAADDLLARPNVGKAQLLFQCGRVYALASAQPRSDALAARAVATLRRAFAAGYPDPTQIAGDDFTPLRDRPDFVGLLWDLADALPVRPAPAAQSK
jgi:tetratricopeptide (TPR) repeat protein